jgi:hypothetical protein
LSPPSTACWLPARAFPSAMATCRGSVCRSRIYAGFWRISRLRPNSAATHSSLILWINGPGFRGHFCMHASWLVLELRNICDNLDGHSQEPNKCLRAGIIHTKMSHR